MPRRRRRPIYIVLVLALIVLAELEVISTAGRLSQVVQSSALSFFLSRVVPVVAVAFLVAPLIHIPRLRSSRSSFPGWMVYGYIAPAYLFLLACVGHAFFGVLFEAGRWVLGLGVPSTSARLFGLSLPFGMAIYGAGVGQLWTRVERGVLELPGMGSELSGLRVVQISDLHAGGLVGARRLNRIARQVASLKPDLVVVTGDIVNASPHEAELVAPILAALPAPLGVWACLGNHDHFVDGNAVASVLERAGIHVLRNRGEVIRRGGSAFWLAGVDDTWTHSDDLPSALAEKPAGMPVLLLAHDPAVWPAAVKRRVEVTLSGHTHGGQFGLVKLHPALSLARLITPFTAGRFQDDVSVLHVSRGTANTLPIRLGAPTEVGLFELVDRAPPAA